ncbi:MAG: YiiD C-terminal domain-containing protein [Rhizobacter sp.]|nr:YiiD C-terminal domain-containing protein [Bacteriovorax sp.]
MNFWPPFWGAGIHIDHISKDFLEIDVSLKLKFWNKNYVGTHYGGSLYSMTDPFYMLMLINLLGKGYIVWDKGATIRFIKPGIGKVFAQFRLTEGQLSEFKTELESKNKIEPVLTVYIKDDEGQVIAEVDKVLYIKKKR